jgi:hypothetical protein
MKFHGGLLYNFSQGVLSLRQKIECFKEKHLDIVSEYPEEVGGPLGVAIAALQKAVNNIDEIRRK